MKKRAVQAFGALLQGIRPLLGVNEATGSGPGGAPGRPPPLRLPEKGRGE